MSVFRDYRNISSQKIKQNKQRYLWEFTRMYKSLLKNLPHLQVTQQTRRLQNKNKMY